LSVKKECWIIASDTARIRLDRFLSSVNLKESRSQIQNWIRKGAITVNGSPVKTGYCIKPDDKIELAIPDPISSEILPEAIPLDVLFEDSDLAVINKPAGLVCHPGAGIRSGTLVNALLYRMGPLQAGDPTRPGIVHRLDKLTSGVMLAAKNNWTHRQLSQQFKSRQVKKEYVALVYGCPNPSFGTIDLPLGRDPRNRKKISTRSRHSRTAITHYDTEKILGPFCLLRVRIETGRTHQIRVHLAQKGHPIVGDSLYGTNRNLPIQAASAVKELHRPFLHSRRLEFRHPRTGEILSFTASIPTELAHFLAEINLLLRK
jgi:23S rRNA pseudouridine1911/1915/1917 synthase